MAAAKTWLGTKDRYARFKKIQTLDPQKNSREITKLFFEDFAMFMLLQGFSGFMLTYAAPTMSRILESTGQSEHKIAKRFLDTTLFAQNLMEHGVESPGPGQDATRRVSSMHRSYDIVQEDFVIVGVDNAVTAIELAEKFGWRPVTDIEREAVCVYFTHMTRNFGGRIPLPSTLPEMREYWDRYANEKVAFEPQNLRLADAMINFIKTLFPSPLRPFVGTLLLAQVDPRIVRAIGKPVPGKLVKSISTSFFKVLALQNPIPDNMPNMLQPLVDKIYPNGYTMDDLGTHPKRKEKAATDEQTAVS